MKTTPRSIRSSLLLLALALTLLATSGCAVNVTRYSDGPLTQYFGKPIPKLDKPIARTLSLEKVTYQTAASMKATMIGDLVAREIYVLPDDVGREVKELLKLDQEFSEEATYTALNNIARNRTKARSLRGNKPAELPPVTTSASTEAYVQRQEVMAREAYRKGDYLSGDIHTSAAQNAMTISQASGRAQASVNLAFSVVNALQVAGEASIKSEFLKLRKWLESSSGAIGPQAPEGTHLSVFFLQFFDAESFQLDSRNRVAVFLVLTGPKGDSTSVLEGSDILNCAGECKLFKPKPTAKVMRSAEYSPDVQKQLGTAEGIQYMMDNGFDTLSGIYQYILLQQGLQKLRKTR